MQHRWQILIQDSKPPGVPGSDPYKWRYVRVTKSDSSPSAVHCYCHEDDLDALVETLAPGVAAKNVEVRRG